MTDSEKTMMREGRVATPYRLLGAADAKTGPWGVITCGGRAVQITYASETVTVPEINGLEVYIRRFLGKTVAVYRRRRRK